MKKSSKKDKTPWQLHREEVAHALKKRKNWVKERLQKKKGTTQARSSSRSSSSDPLIFTTEEIVAQLAKLQWSSPVPTHPGFIPLSYCNDWPDGLRRDQCATAGLDPGIIDIASIATDQGHYLRLSQKEYYHRMGRNKNERCLLRMKNTAMIHDLENRSGHLCWISRPYLDILLRSPTT